MIRNKDYNSLLEYETLRKYESLIAFTTTIEGGVSEGNYTSFNLGEYSGDDLQSVVANRNKLADMLNISIDKLFLPYQTHEDNICIVDSDFLSKNSEQQKRLLNGIDAVITNQKGAFIGVGTADCVPVLIYDPVQKVLAAVHAGWRGTVAKLVVKTISAMVNNFGCDTSNLIAAVGPSISLPHFEVGDEVVEKFVEVGFSLSEIGQKNITSNKWHLDLWEANRILLLKAGLLADNIEVSNLCTYSNAELFFSARRQTIHSGRILTGGLIC